MSKAKRIAVVVLAALGLFAIGWCSPWHGFLYRGDGTFLDQGEWAWPRYILRLKEISLSEPAEYVFHLRGLPTEKLTLMLVVENVATDSTAARVLLTSGRPKIDVIIVNGKGYEVCRASGRPADSNEDGVWVLTSSTGYAAYWAYGCREIQFRSFERYTLKVRISDVLRNGINGDHEQEGMAKGQMVVPTLKGGGEELP